MNSDNTNLGINVDPSTGQFVDPLFAIFIAAAVSDTIIPWTDSGWEKIHIFDICVVIVGFVNLLLSWFGYHKSVSRKPIKGSVRFIVTVILLPLYMLSIILYKNGFLSVMAVYALIFFLWSCWEYFRDVEYNENSSLLSLVFKPYNNLVYISLGAIFIVPYIPKEYANIWSSDRANEVALFLLIFSISWLRISKSAGKEGSRLERIKSEFLNLLFGDRESKT